MQLAVQVSEKLKYRMFYRMALLIDDFISKRLMD